MEDRFAQQIDAPTLLARFAIEGDQLPAVKARMYPVASDSRPLLLPDNSDRGVLAQYDPVHIHVRDMPERLLHVQRQAESFAEICRGSRALGGRR